MDRKVSELYMQQVNIEMMVETIRKEVDRAFNDGALVSMVLGTLRLIAREVEDRAISSLSKNEEDENEPS